MKNFLKKLLVYLKLKRKMKKEFEILTESLDFVNLSLKSHFMKGYEIYNNDDLIAFLDFNEMLGLSVLGVQFFCSLVYCLCVKYSIEKI